MMTKNSVTEKPVLFTHEMRSPATVMDVNMESLQQNTSGIQDQ